MEYKADESIGHARWQIAAASRSAWRSFRKVPSRLSPADDFRGRPIFIRKVQYAPTGTLTLRLDLRELGMGPKSTQTSY